MIKALFKSKKENNSNSGLQHDSFFNSLRESEYNRLDKDNHIYLDYTGGNLYSTSQIQKHYNLLTESTFGNPHSTNPTSRLSTRLVREARQKVIDFFQADDYYCVFTQNASMALKIVGECYPFEENGHFVLLSDNHNSVNGIREYCIEEGGKHDYAPVKHDDLNIEEAALTELLTESGGNQKLFAYPAQSNVSGVKHSLDWIEKAQNLGWDVMLDAAAFVPTSTLNLSRYKPDFVCVSFYKIFGYPTGIGCLLIRKDSFSKLHKRWFAGGTVSLASALTPFHFLADNHERYENGTINYLGIPAIKTGLEYIENIGMQRLNERVGSMISYLHTHLKDLTHSNGQLQLDIFGPADRKNTGGTIIMSFKNPDGNKISFEKIEELANERKISIRSGCFCNPGLDETNNCLTTDELASYFANRETGDYFDMIESLQKLRGATRVSVGIATVQRDLDTYIEFVKSLRDQTIS